MIITILSKMNYLHNLNKRCDLRNCGLRRSRVAANGQGKRGGARVIYYYLDVFKRFYLFSIYAINEMSDLKAKSINLKNFWSYVIITCLLRS
jgi:hypothetical protein